MAIEFEKDDISFRVTDTLHQLVDRLNAFEDQVVHNRKLVDSNLNDLVFMVHRDSGVITADSDLSITDISDFTVVSDNNISMTAEGDVSISSLNGGSGLTTISSHGALTLRSDFDAGNVYLRGSENQLFGMLVNHGGSANPNLKILTGVFEAVTFTEDNASFPGTISVTGLNTTAGTVAEAINEVHSELDSDVSSLTATIQENQTAIGVLEGQMTSTVNKTTSNTNRIDTIEAINIASRLNTIEAQIVQINNRLNILEL